MDAPTRDELLRWHEFLLLRQTLQRALRLKHAPVLLATRNAKLKRLLQVLKRLVLPQFTPTLEQVVFIKPQPPFARLLSLRDNNRWPVC